MEFAESFNLPHVLPLFRNSIVIVENWKTAPCYGFLDEPIVGQVVDVKEPQRLSNQSLHMCFDLKITSTLYIKVEVWNENIGRLAPSINMNDIVRICPYLMRQTKFRHPNVYYPHSIHCIDETEAIIVHHPQLV